MEILLQQIERSLADNLYYLSLMGALTVPDIAGALDSPNGVATGKRYAAWYEKYVRPQFPRSVASTLPPDLQQHLPLLENPLSGKACYHFRCSLLHQGSSRHPKSPYSRIMFIEPGHGPVIHYGILNDALCIDLPGFCSEVIAGARDWLAAVSDTPRFQNNFDRFARRHQNGVPPYIVGVPVVS